MIDFAKIKVIAGRGGSGSGSRRQIKGKRYARADGGDGGRGGDVYLVASGDLHALESYRFVKDYKAQNGEQGSSNLRRGADGQDLVLKVPAGTVANLTNESNLSNGSYDLVAEGDKVLIARAGVGGRGNAHLRDEFGRRPKVGQPGEKGEEVNLTLELKLIADVGLIGLPNAGKSTLLARLTAAKPKIAAYPFTTLEPNLGVMTTDYRLQTTVKSDLTTVDSSRSAVDKPAKLVLADIPGLIEGASTGRGLGDLFLRHIERTKILVHLIDISTIALDTRSPGEALAKLGDTRDTRGTLWNNYQTIRSELKAYSKELAKKKEIIVLNKIDLVDQKAVQAAREEFKKHRKKVVLISAEKGEGLANLLDQLVQLAQLV